MGSNHKQVKCRYYLIAVLLFIPLYFGNDIESDAFSVVVIANYVPVIVYSYAVWLIYHFLKQHEQINVLTIVRIGQDKTVYKYLVDSFVNTLAFNTVVFSMAFLLFGLPRQLFLLYTLAFISYNLIIYVYHLYMLVIRQLSAEKALSTLPIVLNLLLHYSFVNTLVM